MLTHLFVLKSNGGHPIFLLSLQKDGGQIHSIHFLLI